MNLLPTVCVYCGSSETVNEKYLELAADLGRQLAKREFDLVFGGTRIGMMRAVADAVLEMGGRAFGVVPDEFEAIAHTGLTNLEFVEDLSVRKTVMASMGDGYIALPGGYGTLDELTDVVVGSMLGNHTRPVGILNAYGYYDQFLAFTNSATAQGFIDPSYMKRVCVASTAETLLDAMMRIAASENET